MRITARTAGDVTILDLEGNMKAPADLEEFSNAIDGEIGKRNFKILLNFHEVHYINSSGLGRLILAAKKLEGMGGALKVMNLSEDLEELFTFTRLKEKITVYNNEENAINSLKSA